MHHDVVGLDVTMNDSLPVCFVQCGARLCDNFGGGRWRERPALPDDVAYALAFDQFHHQVKESILRDAEVVNRDSVRMLETGGGLRLAPETFGGLWNSHLFGMQDFNRHLVADEQARSAIDRSHAAQT